MAIDTPARIAVLGAGPIGLETALYARFLGYHVDVFERGSVADHVRQWSHVRMFTPFGMNHSPLGRSAIAAQGTLALPGDEVLPTGEQWLSAYLEPLSQVDLLANCLHLNTEVVAIGKESYLKSEMASYEDRFDELFLVLTRQASGEEQWHQADIVIDTTGTFGQPNFCGPGGLPAAGENGMRGADPSHRFAHESPALSYGLPDILTADRERFANRRVLIVGHGFSAATNLAQLLELQTAAPQTCLTWAVRCPAPEGGTDDFPMARIPADRLPERGHLASNVNAAAQDGRIKLLSGVQVERLSVTEAGDWQVEFCGTPTDPQRFDAILANVGFRGDWSLCEELQVHRCYASGAPMSWSAALLKQTGRDCLEVPDTTADSLVTTEPNFYVLGAKSYGRWSHFLYQNGLDQIRQLFCLIGDRPDLDLYRTPLSTPTSSE